MRRHVARWIGVDVGERRKGSDAAVVDDSQMLALPGSSTDVPSSPRSQPIVIERDCVRCAETTSHTVRYSAFSGPTADSAAVGYGGGMGCFAAMPTRTAA